MPILDKSWSCRHLLIAGCEDCRIAINFARTNVRRQGRADGWISSSICSRRNVIKTVGSETSIFRMHSAVEGTRLHWPALPLPYSKWGFVWTSGWFYRPFLSQSAVPRFFFLRIRCIVENFQQRCAYSRHADRLFSAALWFSVWFWRLWRRSTEVCYFTAHLRRHLWK